LRVYALEGEIIYMDMDKARWSVEFENWRLSRLHTLLLVSLRDIVSLDERFWSGW
jgi:hypothetical protein